MRTYKCKVENSLWHCSKGFCDGCDYASCGNDCYKQLLKDVYQEHISDERMIEQQRIKIVEQQAEIERLQKAGEEAVNCFTRMESLYKIKCKELEVAKAEAIKEVINRLEKKMQWQTYGDYRLVRSYLVAIEKEMTEQKE